MFMTLPGFEQPCLPSVLPEGAQCWASLTLGVEIPWFVLRTWFEVDRHRALRTFLVAHESGLIELVSHLGARNIVSIQCLAIPHRADGGWQVCEASRIWRTPGVAGGAHSLVYEFRGIEGAHNAKLEPVTLGRDPIFLDLGRH